MKSLSQFVIHGVLVPVLAVGMLACATPAHAQSLQGQRGGYGVEVLVDGVPAPTFHHRGESYVMGRMGERYVIRVNNYTGRRVEAVVSVDGRDVIDGRTASWQNKRGYLVPAWGSVDIDGWRLSEQQAAAFRFSRVARSYAARTGDARNVGVIGVAVFPERGPVAVPYWPRPHHRHPDYYSQDEAPGKSSRGAAPPPSAAPSSGGRGESAAPADAAAESAPSAGAGAGALRSQPGRPGPFHDPSRPGLGTEFGEATSSPVHEVHFVRANPTHPAVMLGVRYNDRPGLLAVGIDVDGSLMYGSDERVLRGTATPFPASHRPPYAAPPPGWRSGW